MKAVRHNRMYGGVINIPGDIITGRVSPDSERSGSPRRTMKTDRNTLRRRRRRAGGFQRQREILDAVDERSARLLASTTRRLRGWSVHSRTIDDARGGRASNYRRQSCRRPTDRRYLEGEVGRTSTDSRHLIWRPDRTAGVSPPRLARARATQPRQEVSNRRALH